MRLIDTAAYWAIWLSGATIVQAWGDVPSIVRDHPNACAIAAIAVGGVAMGYLDSRVQRGSKEGRDNPR